MKQVAQNIFWKNEDVFRTVMTAKMELFVVLVSRFQPNLTKNPNICAREVLDAPLEY